MLFKWTELCWCKEMMLGYMLQILKKQKSGQLFSLLNWLFCACNEMKSMMQYLQVSTEDDQPGPSKLHKSTLFSSYDRMRSSNDSSALTQVSVANIVMSYLDSLLTNGRPCNGKRNSTSCINYYRGCFVHQPPQHQLKGFSATVVCLCGQTEPELATKCFQIWYFWNATNTFSVNGQNI